MTRLPLQSMRRWLNATASLDPTAGIAKAAWTTIGSAQQQPPPITVPNAPAVLPGNAPKATPAATSRRSGNSWSRACGFDMRKDRTAMGGPR